MKRAENERTLTRDVIVVAASAGGVVALMRLCRDLPADLPASVFVVIHIGAHESRLPDLLGSCGQLPAVHASHGESLQHGRIYIAPPDHHLLLEGGLIRLTHGPKEHHTRPAADPLFRSAALNFGLRTIGVVLSGHLDDGTAGLQAIKDCGGVAVVKDPAQAEAPGIPASALDNVDVDHCVGLDELAATLNTLSRQPIEMQPVAVPARLVREHLASISEGQLIMENLQAIGQPSTLVCPECSGTLWEIKDATPKRFRCHTGHAYSLQSLSYHQANHVEAALWSVVRALQDREVLLHKLAQACRDAGEPREADYHDAEAERVNAQALLIQQMVSEQAQLKTEPGQRQPSGAN